MKSFLIFGTGGLAREFTSYFEDFIDIVGFSSSTPEEHDKFNLPGKIFDNNVNPDIVGTDLAVLAVGSPLLRKKIAEVLQSKGFKFPSIIHPSSVVSKLSIINDGVVISPNCTVSPNVKLGSFTYINFNCGIGHDASIGQFVQINPGTQIGGGAIINDQTLIGSGSTVLQNVKVLDNVTIGSGSVVFSRVKKGITVMGNPAKRVRIFETD